jgi:menaquinol-cytochrome c reductase iron-sulfur subunit
MESNTRRSFLGRLTGAVVALGALVASWPFVRSLVPNVLYEPPKRFKVGNPDRLQQGATFFEEQRVFIFRDGNSLHAISGVCSHLGCTVKFAPTDSEFHCPCHGSRFRSEGTNYAGPAPGPLKWFRLEISPADGALIVDLGQEVKQEFRLVV